jgi:acyl carrier protein
VVREAVVLARDVALDAAHGPGHWSRGSGDVPSGEKQLVAYVIAAEGVQIQVGELREQLSRELAEYMIPSAFVQLEAFPLTPNGKLDRKALPAPDGAAYRSQQYEAPQGEVEQTLARIWSELLQREGIGRHDNFFAIGGHSLLAVQAITRIKLEFDVDITLDSLFSSPTIATLDQCIVEAQLAQFDSQELADLMVRLADDA